MFGTIVALVVTFFLGLAVNLVSPVVRDRITLLSRRRMQDLFLKHVGHTISEEIRRRRVDHAKKLLAETQTKVGLIASQAGFGSAERMSKVFRQVVGMTPHDYRDGYRHDEAGAPGGH